MLLELGGAEFQGITRMEPAKFIRPMLIQIWLCGESITQPTYLLHGKRAQLRDNGNCLSSPHPEPTQLSLSLRHVPSCFS